MSLTTHKLDILVDLVEIKLSCMEVHDKADKREFNCLETCREELLQLRQGSAKTNASPHTGSRRMAHRISCS